MRHGSYKLKDFLTDNNLSQIIIPEIQRDYVWQEDNVEKFLQSILDNSKRQEKQSQELTEETLSGLSSRQRELLLRDQKANENYCQVGFIYAYPTASEISGDCYILIDGQQRMTTLFLTLLALSMKEGRQDNFRRDYFKDDFLKLDYKVRESSHEFMQKFIPYILNRGDIEKISNEYWNFTEYQYDKTIKSIIANYKVIKRFIDKHDDLLLNYVEKYIEFWYFDTSKSDQGEKLYLYMNSRGETISPNESIKANLLRGLTNQEKHNWGKEWERWQNFFWRYRQSNSNADRGIEEFLKWIKFIEITRRYNKEQTKSSLSAEIRKIKESKKISLEELSLQKIESYFNAIEKLIKLKDKLNFDAYWLTGYNKWKEVIPGKDYVKLIPMLMYVERYPNSDLVEIKRFARFFMNITRFDTINKSPYLSIVDVILLTNLFLEKGFTDITNITIFETDFKNILSEEEIVKLSIYKQSSDDLRNEIENAFWEAEDYKFCDGKISLIWNCIDFDKSDISTFDSQKLSDFKDCFDNFKKLFDNPTDLVRRALLTKGDYKVQDGYSSFLGQVRYSFINEDERWKEQLSSNEKMKLYISLIKDFGDRKKINDTLTKDDILNQIITDFWNNKTDKDWLYYFVKDGSLLHYCQEKKICWSDNVESIVLLKSTKVMTNNWSRLRDYLNQLK